ncbi:GNAT family N-acetyltransferase [Halobacillus sp. KGW1]|uniref:GNAT family N-acetyltransferase n=1 Tax=Halobacillus sp. KGW1 TaxID=1793726 RepID=UPI000781F0C6|nr:GNAT family protein [Halobacillus sp. KGW1]
MRSVIESKRIYFREVEEGDWPAFYPFASNEEAVRYQPWGPNTPEDCQFFVRQVMYDRQQRHRSRFVFVIVSRQDGVILGNMELNIRDWDGVGEIGFIINPDYWGKGYATEAVHLILDYSFGLCGLHRIAAVSCPENKACIRVLEKAKMVREGLLRKDLFIKGKWMDSCVYSMLKEEWEQGKRSAEPAN